jgi:3-oxoacyl-[acyl-carrier protein] reductase
VDLGIAEKNALVLASSQGLGLAIATKLRAEGANVMLCGRSTDKLESAANRLSEIGPGTAHYVTVDLFEQDAADTLYRAARDKLGSVDILVNNTGGPPPSDVSTPDTALWHRQIDAMLIRVIEITNRCVPDMKTSGWGRVLTIASAGVLQPIPNLAMSNTIRSALVGWNKSLSNEVSTHGITCNMLLPGRIDTERVAQLDAATAARMGITFAEAVAAARATIPMGRYGTVEEFASVGAFLVSEPASYLTGSLIRCDGGLVKGV